MGIQEQTLAREAGVRNPSEIKRKARRLKQRAETLAAKNEVLQCSSRTSNNSRNAA